MTRSRRTQNRHDGRMSSMPHWQVRIVVDGHAADAEAAARHLERFGWRIVELGPHGPLMEAPFASDQLDAEGEARLCLAMWHHTHPGVAARVEPSRYAS